MAFLVMACAAQVLHVAYFQTGRMGIVATNTSHLTFTVSANLPFVVGVDMTGAA
jgi:hypothetical protein